ncbi:MAG: hypothetical protein K2Z81_28770 [Cyanobacteria bacterium]|nr:hypothetical protein [Cyanobacteriota bacterium]
MQNHTGNLSKQLSFLTIALFILVFCQLDAFSAEPVDKKSELSADKKVTTSRNNSGRQLAVAGGDISHTPTVDEKDKLSAQATINDTRSKLAQQLKLLNIDVKLPEVKIPKNLEDTCDTCLTEGKKAVLFAHEHSVQFTNWFGRYVMQFIEPPKVTPVGSPYLMESKLVPSNIGARSSKLYLTQEGRLKTVTSR